jgi:hypothetical protein
MADAAWLSLGSGLVGVFVGGAINWRIQDELLKRRERAEVRASIRLLDAELIRAQSAVHTSLLHNVWFTREGVSEISVVRWRNAEGVLGAALTRQDFQPLSLAYGRIEDLNMIARIAAREADDPLDDEARNGVYGEVLNLIRDARTTLGILTEEYDPQ